MLFNFFLRNYPNKTTRMEASGLPLYSGPVDHLRHGFRSLENELSAQHPIQLVQKSNTSSAWMAKLDVVRRTHGSHMAMRLATERETFSRIRRLPGLESSHIALQTMMGTDETIDFPDFLNAPADRPDVPRLELHSQMEVKLGIM